MNLTLEQAHELNPGEAAIMGFDVRRVYDNSRLKWWYVVPFVQLCFGKDCLSVGEYRIPAGMVCIRAGVCHWVSVVVGISSVGLSSTSSSQRLVQIVHWSDSSFRLSLLEAFYIINKGTCDL